MLTDIVKYFISIYLPPPAVYEAVGFSTVSQTVDIIKLLSGFQFAFLIISEVESLFRCPRTIYVSLSVDSFHSLTFKKLVVGLVLLISRSSLYVREIVI